MAGQVACMRLERDLSKDAGHRRVKGKFTLKQDMKAQRGSRGRVLLFL